MGAQAQAPSQGLKFPRHKLAQIDEDSLTADCSVCETRVTIVRCKSRVGFACIEPARRSRRKEKLRSYGLTVAEYAELLERQGGGCAICGAAVADARGRPLHVDHEHSTGAVRGLLCVRCNAAVGYVRDDPAIALRVAEYLEDHLADRLRLFRSA